MAEKAEPMEQDPPAPERPLLNVPLATLRAEIARLEKHLLDMPSEGFQGLRDQTELSLMAAKKELQARKPKGATLDQAIARQRQANKARTVAESHVQDLKDSLSRAETALSQAIEQEHQANQEVQRVRSLISEHDPGSEIRMPTPCNVSSAVLVGLYQFLQTAGLDYQQMAQVATVLGATAPPTPPAAAPTHGQTSLQEQLPTALPQQNQLGALTARPQGVPAPQAVLTLQEQGLAHPANLASQLLGSQPAAQGGTAPPPQRQGRSPAPKRSAQTQVAWQNGRSRQGLHLLLALALRQECFPHAGPRRPAPGTKTHPKHVRRLFHLPFRIQTHSHQAFRALHHLPDAAS